MTRSYHGPLTAILWGILEDIYMFGGASIQSNLAREFATEIGLLASMGWVTTITHNGNAYGRVWRVTSRGLTAIDNKDHFACSPPS